MHLGVELFVDVKDDVVFEPLHVEIDGLEKRRKAGGGNSQTWKVGQVFKKPVLFIWFQMVKIRIYEYWKKFSNQNITCCDFVAKFYQAAIWWPVVQ